MAVKKRAAHLLIARARARRPHSVQSTQTLNFRHRKHLRASNDSVRRSVHEDLVVELLPAQRDMRDFLQASALLDERRSAHTMQSSSSAIRNAPRELRPAAFGASWRRMYRRGAATRPRQRCLSAHWSDPAAACRDRLRQAQGVRLRAPDAGRARLEGARERTAGARVLLGTSGMRCDATARLLLEALVTRRARGDGADAHRSSRSAAKPTTLRVNHAAARRAARLDAERTVAIDHGNHLARWLTTLPPNVLDSDELSTRAAASSRAGKAGDSTFLDETTLQRRGAGAFLAVSRANDHRDAGIVRLRYRRAQRSKSAAAARARRQRHLLRHRRHQSQDRTRACTRCTRTCRAAPSPWERCSRCSGSMRHTTSTAGSRSRRTRSARAPIDRRKS